jgi:hypothetical protein
LIVRLFPSKALVGYIAKGHTSSRAPPIVFFLLGSKTVCCFTA